MPIVASKEGLQLRILGVVRLSHSTDVTTSPERQRRSVGQYVQRDGHDLVGWVEDVDVSGVVSVFDRPGLGPWLRDRADEFDALCVWRADRYSRDLRDTLTLVDWCQAHGKALFGAEQHLDVATPHGRLSFTMAIAMAQAERELMQERARSSVRELMRTGRYRGGPVPYGYAPEPDPAGGKRLVIEPVGADLMREVVRRAIAGESATSICADLNRRGVPTSEDRQRMLRGKPTRGTVWKPGNLKRLLRSPALLGQGTVAMKDSEGTPTWTVMRDETGLPVQRADPLITQEEYDRLQAALSARQNMGRKTKLPPSLAQGLCYCGRCGQKMYLKVSQRLHPVTGVPLTYIYCPSVVVSGLACGMPSIREEVVADVVWNDWLNRVADLEVRERVLIPGNRVARDLAITERNLAALRADRAAGLYASPRDEEEYRSRDRALVERRDALAQQEPLEDHWEWLGTGRSWLDTVPDPARGGEWQHNEDLRRAGVRVVISEPVAGDAAAARVAVTLPPDLEERVQEDLDRRGLS